MPKKSYITFKDMRAFWDRKSDTIKLTSGDPELAARGWSLTLNRASRDEQILRDALTEAGVIPADHQSTLPPSLILTGSPGAGRATGPVRVVGKRSPIASDEELDGFASPEPTIPHAPFTAEAPESRPEPPVDEISWGYPKQSRPGDPLTDPNNIKYGVSKGGPRGTLMNDALDELRDAGLKRVQSRRGGAANDGEQAHPHVATSDPVLEFTFDDLLRHMLDIGGTDLQLIVGREPLVRAGGKLVPLMAYGRLLPENVEDLILPVLTGEQYAKFAEYGELDMPYTLAQGVRFRVNVFRHGKIGVIARHLTTGPGGGGGGGVTSPVGPQPTPNNPRPRPGQAVPVPVTPATSTWTSVQAAGDRERIREGERELVRGRAQARPMRINVGEVRPGSVGEYVGVTQPSLTTPVFFAPHVANQQAVDSTGAFAGPADADHPGDAARQILGDTNGGMADRFTKQQLDLVRDSVDMHDFLVDQGIRFTKNGGRWVTTCPLHNEPQGRSFSIKVGAQEFRCLGCGQHGDIFVFVQAFEGVSFNEAVRRLLAWLAAPATDDYARRREADLQQRVAARRADEEATANDTTEVRFAKVGEAPDEAPAVDLAAADPAEPNQKQQAATVESEGSYLGWTTRSLRNPVYFDPFKQIWLNCAPGVLITGAPGSGKSFLMFKTAHDLTARGVQTVYIDPHGDAVPLTTMNGLDVQHLPLGDAHDGMLDPLRDINRAGVKRHDRLDAAMDALGLLFGHATGSLRPDARAVLNQTVEEVAAAPDASLNLLLTRLRKRGKADAVAASLHAELEQFNRLPFGRLLFGKHDGKGQTPGIGRGLTVISARGLDLPSSNVARDAYSNANRLAVAVMHLLLVEMREQLIAQDKGRQKALLVDGVDALAVSPAGQRIIVEITRMGRSLNTSLILAGHNPQAFLNGVLLNGIATRFVFRTHGPDNIDAALTSMGLAKNNFNRNAVRNLANGECMLQRPGSEISTVQIDAHAAGLRAAFGG